MLTVVTPLMLLVTLLLALKSLLIEGYGDYPLVIQFIFGWGCVIGFAVGAMLLSQLKDHNK